MNLTVEELQRSLQENVREEMCVKREEMMCAAIRTVAAEHAGADANAFAKALVNYEQPWDDQTGFENWEGELEPTVATETDQA